MASSCILAALEFLKVSHNLALCIGLLGITVILHEDLKTNKPTTKQYKAKNSLSDGLKS